MFDEQPDGDPHGECTAEIHRLQAALKKANDQAEHFERLWYLRGDALEWYRAEAQAISKNMQNEVPAAVQASVVVLALDAGRRADTALRHNVADKRPVLRSA